jgi:hypothetical protein
MRESRGTVKALARKVSSASGPATPRPPPRRPAARRDGQHGLPLLLHLAAGVRNTPNSAPSCSTPKHVRDGRERKRLARAIEEGGVLLDREAGAHARELAPHIRQAAAERDVDVFARGSGPGAS